MSEHNSGGSEAAELRTGRGGQKRGHRMFSQSQRPEALAPTGNLTLGAEQKRQIREAMERRKRAAQNRFYSHHHGQLVVPLPPDDATWHYALKRVTLNGQPDRINVQLMLTGQLQYVPVKLEELPADYAEQLGPYRIKDGDFAGLVGIEDVLLMRCRIEDYREDMEAAQLRADDMYFSTQTAYTDAAERMGLLPIHQVQEGYDYVMGQDGRIEEVTN